MKKFGKVHPYLFTLASLIFIYPITAVIASPGQVIRSLVLLLVFLMILSFFAHKLVKNQDWAAILLSVIVLGMYSTSLFFYVAGLILFAVIILWWLISHFRKRKFRVKQISLLLNVVSILLIAISIARAIPLFNQVKWASYRQGITSFQENLVVFPVIPETKPDIYYIVLDGYARADVLDELYKYDNAEFIDYLASKGFIVPTNSRSNYPKTALSITSTLNMDYIPVGNLGITDSVFWWLMSPLIDHSRVRAILEQVGYQTVSIVTDWSITDNPTTNMYFKPYPVHINDFEAYLLAQSPLSMLKPLFRKFADIPSFDMHGQIAKYNFEKLSEIPKYKDTTYTFAHIISPHPPFVFDQDGNPLNPDYPFSFNDANDFPGSDEEYRQSYIAQLEFVNKQLVQLIDVILEESDVPPIIVIQADHGPGMLTDFRSSTNTCLKERFSVFAAYYFPGLDETIVPDDISAVNVFRLIFNQYFSADLPLLENDYFYYKDTIYIYRAENVSTQIDRACETQK